MANRSRSWALLVVLGLGACGTGGEGREVGEAGAALSVTWMNAVGVSAVGNSLTKTDPASTWQAGAASVESIPGSGYVEFSSGESTTSKMAGLSHGDAGQRYNDIDFAIHLTATARVRVYEAGVLRGTFGMYAAGDLFRVENTGGVVTYARNGAVFYTSAVAPTAPLLVDTSLYTPGATIQGVVLVRTSITWQNLVGVSASGDDLTKTAPESSWLAGAASVDELAGDGRVEFTSGESNTAKMAGLSHGDAGQRYTDIDFAVYLKATGRFGVYEAGVLVNGNFGVYAPGDVFRVESAGGVVTYARNEVVFYTSLAAPIFPLLVDTSFYTPGATVRDVVLTEAVGGGCSPGATECSDCIDNDGDGRVDGQDPECTGAIDNDESSFATGIPGDSLDDKWQDCFTDGNSGAGDDGCRYHTCCLLGATSGADCPVDANFDPTTDCLPQTQMCLAFCQPITQPGCDCFGCCTMCDGAGCSDVLVHPAVAPACQYESLHDPDLCPSCVKAPDCSGGDCGGCVLCPGQIPEDRPPECAPAEECPAAETPCDAAADCTAAEYCSSSYCCIGTVP